MSSFPDASTNTVFRNSSPSLEFIFPIKLIKLKCFRLICVAQISSATGVLGSLYKLSSQERFHRNKDKEQKSWQAQHRQHAWHVCRAVAYAILRRVDEFAFWNGKGSPGNTRFRNSPPGRPYPRPSDPSNCWKDGLCPIACYFSLQEKFTSSKTFTIGYSVELLDPQIKIYLFSGSL